MFIRIKREKAIMKKIITSICIVTVLSSLVFAGCGTTNTSVATQSSVAPKETTAQPSESSAASTGKVDDDTFYKEIIDGLDDTQAYAFAPISTTRNALLVTSYVYDNLDGNLAAIDATVYCAGPDGKVMKYGEVASSGTAYPLAVLNDLYLMYGGNHDVSKVYIDTTEGKFITVAHAEVSYDTNGTPTYTWICPDEKYDGIVKDDSKMCSLYEDYGECDVINFTTIGEFTVAEETETEEISEPEMKTYSSKSGWTVEYDASCMNAMEINDHESQFVYMKECAGTNMVIISYLTGADAETVRNKFADNMGENARLSEGIFPGTADTKSFVCEIGDTVADAADVAVAETASSDEKNAEAGNSDKKSSDEKNADAAASGDTTSETESAGAGAEISGSGYYETVITGPYKDGVLVMDIIEHHGIDELMNMTVSDALGVVINSISFGDPVSEETSETAETTAK